MQSNTLYDCTLVCNGHEIPAAKCILAANSPYFEGMFYSGMDESQKDRIRIDYFDHYVLEKIVEYCNTQSKQYPIALTCFSHQQHVVLTHLLYILLQEMNCNKLASIFQKIQVNISGLSSSQIGLVVRATMYNTPSPKSSAILVVIIPSIRRSLFLRLAIDP
ncbi:unnamed protein product [Protopolystoma xenopodis]|uniref:BTB domain-containing protein n=1 Tax=Protopolystoma xenopodis TaxID=117903 RepID=A0A448WYY0_9PLAT|nr:unnamed protein product [Protopolystoma xenopodis]